MWVLNLSNFSTALEGDVVISTASEKEAHHTPFNTLVLSSSANETGVELTAADD